MSSSDSNVPYVPMFPIIRDFVKKNGEKPTRKEWDDMILNNPRGYENLISEELRAIRYPDSEIKKVIAKMHQESQRRKLEKMQRREERREERWEEIFALVRTDKPPEGTVTSPIIIEDDDDEPQTSSSASRKRRLDVLKSLEQPLSKKRQRRKMIDDLDKELKRLEEALKNLPETQRKLGTPSSSDEDTQWSP